MSRTVIVMSYDHIMKNAELIKSVKERLTSLVLRPAECALIFHSEYGP
jgi:hypothetical protein